VTTGNGAGLIMLSAVTPPSPHEARTPGQRRRGQREFGSGAGLNMLRAVTGL